MDSQRRDDYETADLYLQFTIRLLELSQTPLVDNRFIYGNRDNAIPGYQSFMSTAYSENGHNEAMKRSLVIH